MKACQYCGPAWVDARHLIERRWRGLKWGKDAMTLAPDQGGPGWVPTRWYEAFDILKRSGIAVQKGRNYVPWDETVNVNVALAMFAEYQQATLKAAGRRFAASSDEATPEVATSSEDE